MNNRKELSHQIIDLKYGIRTGRDLIYIPIPLPGCDQKRPVHMESIRYDPDLLFIHIHIFPAVLQIFPG